MVKRALIVVLLVLLGGAVRSQPAGQDAVTVEVVSLGVGGMAKASDWAGILVEFSDQGTSQREVIIEVKTRDVDGDRPRYQRTVTTNPGAGAERVWVYAYLQPADEDRPLTVSAYEALPAPAGLEESAGVRFVPGDLLGRTTTAGRPVRPSVLGTMLVVGRQPAGLAGYGSRASPGDRSMARGHEVIDVASDLDPLSLPDQAIGYSGIETIVWTSADPTRLTPTRATALQDWVRDGGHLVVSLPPTPQVWFDTMRNPLAELLPRVEASRSSEGVEPLRPLLTYDDAVAIPDSAVVHTLLVRADAERGEAWRILEDAAGRTIAARKRHGLGCVTLIGFDVSNRAFARMGMPGMRPFWHRVLGRTGLPRDADDPDRVTIAPRFQERVFDGDIADIIAKSQAVVLGVLGGFGVFGLYWLIAAPVSYAVLKKLSLGRHAWVVFAACVALFAAVTWGGVALLRPSTPEVQAVVFVDAAEGTTQNSARAFATVLVPKYGLGGLRVGTGEDGESGAIAPWADPGATGIGAVSGGFPDVRGYAMSGREPDRMVFPARSTVKTVRADWSGERQWAAFRAVDETGAPGRLELDPGGAIAGGLTHGLPGPLEDAIVIVVPPQERLAKRVGQADITQAQVRRLPSGGWAPGTRLDLRQVFTPGSEVDAAAARQRDRDFFAQLATAGTPFDGIDVSLQSRVSRQSDRLMAAALMSRMTPPRQSGTDDRPKGLRRVTHGLDMGEWFTQPSVIVLGIVRITPETGLPLPLSIRDGDDWLRLGGDGLAVVRWVYTLNDSPPDASVDDGLTGTDNDGVN
ncbi:MAG: DUF4350 domain-containing protein [Planctomycetota bacterium]